MAKRNSPPEQDPFICKARQRAKLLNMPRPGIDLTNRERECLTAVREDTEARDALQFFARKTGRTEETWITIFVVTAWAEESERRLFHRPKPGDSRPEDLLKDAKRVSETGEIIRRLNGQPSWHPEYPDVGVFEDEDIEKEPVPGGGWFVRPHRRAFEETKRAFENLPRTLETYAESLSHKAWYEFGLCRQQRRRGKLQHQMESALLEYVQKLTGRKYREKVAAILRVVNARAGVPTVEAESLRKREQRKRA